MSLFEEHLTLGQWLSEEERLALYKYLLIFHREKYNLDYEKLVSVKSVATSFANGEILYSIHANEVSYKSRKMGSELYSSENRDGGYSTNFYPFYDLNYYSNGRGKILGLIKKFQAKDDELLEKLLAS
jgi:hypothetical protein